jgi:HD superfamily phosphohydrolase
MPPASELKLPAWIVEGKRAVEGRRADHEDYTLKLLLDSGLAAEISRRFSPRGIEPSHIAGLVRGKRPPGSDPYRSGARDYLPILRSIVSGELDADRMDYLLRDSFFTGVNYGKFDLDWLVQNLEAIEREGRVHLALQKRAVFAFEDFLLSRYHMFLSVYLHYASVGYEVLLQRYCETNQGEYALPSDIDEYLQHDDIALTAALRASKNPWALRVVRRQGYRMIHETDELAPVEKMEEKLDESGIDCFRTASKSVLSTYGSDAPLWVKTPRGEVPIADYTPLYERYREPALFARLYVVPERADEARRLLGV